MDHSKVLKQAWNMLWSYRALWIFGIILALTTSSWSSLPPRGDNVTWTEDWTGRVPFYFDRDDSGNLDFSWSEDFDFQELEQMFETGVIPPRIVRILVWTGIALFLLFVISRVARYVAEASLLRMVDDYARTGERRSVGKGFRLGWSRTAWRLFLINLLIDIPAFLLILLLLALAAIPLFTAVGWGVGRPSIGSLLLSTGLFFPILILIIIISAALTLLKRLSRRACALEGVGAVESIGRGFAIARQHLKDVGITWLVTLGVRLVWMFVLVPACVLGLVSGGAVVAGISLLLVGGWEAIILAVVIFLLILLVPLAFLAGLVEVFLSALWTLSYRELLALESPSQDDGQEQEQDQEQEQRQEAQ